MKNLKPIKKLMSDENELNDGEESACDDLLGFASLKEWRKWKTAAERLAGGDCRNLKSGEILQPSDIYSNNSQCHLTRSTGKVVKHLTAMFFRPNA